MRKGKLKGLLLLAFTILFNILFWHEALGVNLMLYTVALTALIFIMYPDVRGKGAARWVAIGGLLGALATVIFNSMVAKIATMASLTLLNGFAMFPEAKSLISAFAAAVTSFCGGFLVGLGKHADTDTRFEEAPAEELPPPTKWKRWVKLAIIPIAITFVFYLIFSAANPVFAKFAEHLNTYIFDLLERIFSGWTIERVAFSLLGIYLVSTVLFHWLPEFFPAAEAGRSNQVQPREGEWSFVGWLGLNGLKDETLVGIITLVLVNLLIFIVNGIDVSTLWFNFNYEDGMNLSALVHEGTYWLIFSILLSMGILMYFFRGNQNFNEGNTGLKALTYLWILQNAVMIVSVVIRNYHYIDNHGLTYKRIGVYIFLLMTLIGLITLVVKIASQRSNFFLWRINTWAGYAVLVLFSFWNWDFFIAEYNIQTVRKQTLPVHEPTNKRGGSYHRSDKVDLPYLIRLSDKALPALLKHPHFEDDNYLVGRSSLKFLVKTRYEWMEQRNEKHTFLSWNHTDAQALLTLRAYFTAHPYTPSTPSSTNTSINPDTTGPTINQTTQP